MKNLNLTTEQYQLVYNQVMADIMKNVIQQNTASADMTTNPQRHQFLKDIIFSTEHEMLLYQMLNMGSTQFELKTVKHSEWSKNGFILIECWKYAFQGEDGCKPGSLFQTDAKWWVHQLIQQDGSSIYHFVEVDHLKKHYNAIKHNQSLFEYIQQPGKGEPCYCFKLDILNHNTFELLAVSQERDIYKRKYEQLLNELK